MSAFTTLFQDHAVKKNDQILKYYTYATQLYVKNLSKESIKEGLGRNQYELIVNIKLILFPEKKTK